ncbi:MAG TPA: hypothetical protein VFX59_19795 [Polyangiales bacterium]|nr:hypothetical protein [Polyangiales bacterium]
MRTPTRIYQQANLAEALAHEEEDMPLPGLVDLRHKSPLLAQTQVLDQEQLRKLRSDYEALRGPLVSEPRDGELTDRTLLNLKPRPVRRLIGVLVAILVALGSWSVCRSWMAGQHVARASSPAAVPVLPEAPAAVVAPSREVPPQPASANLPRVALEALASGDREAARRAYSALARYEREPGPFSAAAEILTRELKAGE